MGFNENNAFDGIRDDDLWKVDDEIIDEIVCQITCYISGLYLASDDSK